MDTSTQFPGAEQPLSWRQRLVLSRFFRGEAPVSGPIELTQRRIFILPTQRGLGMVFTIILMLLMAFIYNNNLVYLQAFLLASLFFVTILHTYKSLAGLLVVVASAKPVFAGELASFSLTVTNPVNQVRPSLVVSLENELAFNLTGMETTKLGLLVKARRRGWQALSTVTLSSQYPLGIFRTWSPLRFDARVLVYPRPSSEALPFPIVTGDRASGLKQTDRAGVDDFNGIREYQIGDSPRQIHWKAYAKGQGLFSKQYASDVGNCDLWLSLEQAPGADLEERLSRLCRWVLDAEAAGLRYGLRLPTATVALDNGPQHQAECLAKLAEV